MSELDPYMPSVGSPEFAVERTGLDIHYHPATGRLGAEAALDIRMRTASEAIDLDLEGLRVGRVALDGRAWRFSQEPGILTVPGPGLGEPGTAHRMTVAYSGFPSTDEGPWGVVGWLRRGDNAAVVGRPDSGPHWYPCNATLGARAPFQLTVTTAPELAVISGGRLVSAREAAGSKVWVFEESEPITPSAAALWIGHYTVEKLGGPERLSPVLAYPKDAPRPDHPSISRHAELFDFLVRLLGPYPFAAYSLVVEDSPSPRARTAHASLAIHPRELATPLRDAVAIGLASQWLAVSVTPRLWRDAWCATGMSRYAAWLWIAHEGRNTVDGIAHAAYAALADLPQNVVLSDPGLARAFDPRLPIRGALALHSLRLGLGDEAFFAMFADWASGRPYSASSTPGFVAHAARFAPAPAAADAVTARLDAWLNRPALPACPG
ncbi:MAG: hypothetical protein LBT54_00505 [Bifidobacteriaceae bacterium]|nr:hypothetical protein [Bifidobacteriaceae bacterium]